MKKWLAFTLTVLLFISCQSESMVEDTSGALGANSQLTQALSVVAATAYDPGYVIDSTHCFNIKLPLMVKINGQELHITSESDYAAAEILLGQSTVAPPVLEYVFPVIIVYPVNNVELKVNNIDEYKALRRTCEGNTDYLSPGCFSINYPVTVLSYNSSFQVQQNHMISNDKELYNFLKSLAAGQYYAVNYPVTIQVGGKEIAVATNAQLQQLLSTAALLCMQ